MLMITDLFAMTDAERAAVDDQTLLSMSYAISGFEPWDASEFSLEHQFNVRLELVQRIRTIKATMPARQRAPVEMAHCDCGHECRRRHVMSTSNGTSCPACYDRMSA